MALNRRTRSEMQILSELREATKNRDTEKMLELEEELNTLEFKVDESDWEPDPDYRRQIDEMRLSLEEAEKSIKDIAASSDAAWKVRFEEMENHLKSLGDRLKEFRTRVRGFFLE